MKNIKSHFEMNLRFRNGIFLLSIFLFIIVIGYYFLIDYKESKTIMPSELAQFQKQVNDLQKDVALQEKTYTLRPFNPNFISDYKGYALGLSAVELDRLYAYRNKGQWINSVADFKKLTGVDDAILQRIAPLFKFPDWKKNRANTVFKNRRKKTKKKFLPKRDLNTVSVQELQEVINVPEFVAKRIVTYRSRINGFVHISQLKDIKGLYPYHQKKIKELYQVSSQKMIKKVNVNNAAVKELLQVPYFDFEMALDIRDFIKTNGAISDLKELGKIEGFSLDKIDRIALYLTVK